MGKDWPNAQEDQEPRKRFSIVVSGPTAHDLKARIESVRQKMRRSRAMFRPKGDETPVPEVAVAEVAPHKVSFRYLPDGGVEVVIMI